jgi:hypothetical protein
MNGAEAPLAPKPYSHSVCLRSEASTIRAPSNRRVEAALSRRTVRPPNGSLTQPRRGPVRQRQSGAPLAATNVKTAGSVCKRRDAVRLGRKKGLQPRANERLAVGCSEKLAAAPSTNGITSAGFQSSLAGEVRV